MSLKKEITGGTIATILGTLLIPFVYVFWNSLWTYLITPAIGFFTNVSQWFVSPFTTPWWLFLAISGICIFYVGRSVIGWFQTTPTEKGYLEFTEMEFRGFIWRWNWGMYGECNLLPYCSNCDRLARYAEGGAFRSAPNVKVFCSNCQHEGFEKVGTFEELKNDAHLEIEYAVRTGRWKRWVKPKEPSARSA